VYLSRLYMCASINVYRQCMYVSVYVGRFRHTWRSLRASCLDQKDHNHSCIDTHKHVNQNKNQNFNKKVE